MVLRVCVDCYYQFVLSGFPTTFIYDLDIQFHVSCIIELRSFAELGKTRQENLIMKKNITRFLLLVGMVLCALTSVQAQSLNQRKGVEEYVGKFEQKKPSVSDRMAKVAARLPQLMEQKASAHRALQTRAEEGSGVVLLDSVISDTHRAYYEYNDYGWLVSARIYNMSDGNVVFDTEESYLLEYDFDAQGRCTRYAQFMYNDDGTKGTETERVLVTWTGGKAHTEQYFALPYEEEWNQLEPTSEISYDEFGNYCLLKFYDWDSESKTMVIEEHWEMRFTGNVMEYYYDDEGNYEGMDFGDDFDLHCYYYVDYYLSGYDDDTHYRISGFKTDKTTDGVTVTKTRYEMELDESEGDVIDLAKADTYWEFAREEEITLTPSRTRYASIYCYEAVREEMEDNEYVSVTRAEVDKILDIAYTFEWDGFGRLVKFIESEGDGDDLTYTCSYHNDDYTELTLEQFEKNWVNNRSELTEGCFYGPVHKERYERQYAYAEHVTDEYDANGNRLHYTVSEVYYSDEELGGEDLNGDGIISTERETFNYEYWFTYDADGNEATRIFYSSYNEAYVKYEYVDEYIGERYYTGERQYSGTSKDGPWTLTYETIQVLSNKLSPENPEAKWLGEWYRSYDPESRTWSGYKRELGEGGCDVEYSIEPQTGEFIAQNDNNRPEGELQEGGNDIYFEENGWIYSGYKYASYVWDETSGTEVLQVTDGWMNISRTGSSDDGYRADDPAENYVFPAGMFFEGVGIKEELSPIAMTVIDVEWNVEASEWQVSYGMGTATVTSHYTNEKGQIVNEAKTYAFDTASGRMVALPDIMEQTIYSFDALGRLSTIEYATYTVHYIYLNDDCNYLSESYSVDKASGGKYDVCKYYYSDGKYTPPYTDIEEVKVAEKAWSFNGTSVIADGDIVLYTVSGQIVARGNGVVVAPQGGLYIVEVNGIRTKIVIK